MRFLFLPLVLFVAGCSGGKDPVAYLNLWGVQSHSVVGFDHCKGYGCKLIDHVVLTPAQWRRIDFYFPTRSRTAEEERARLEPVMGEFERIVGPITNTHTDIRDTFYAFGDDQLDCVDESINTTTYLLLLRERGHIRFHEIEAPKSRPPILAGSRWPHQAAVVRDSVTQTRYVVDSWFEDNGESAYVVPVDEWYYNWSPRKSGRKKAREKNKK